MFTFYGLSIFPDKWIVVIKDGKKVHRIINDKGALLRALSSVKFLVGYNNYRYDDIILWAILYDKNPYLISKELQNGNDEEFRFVKLPYVTLDASQEIGSRPLDLAEIQAYRGNPIPSIDVDFHRPLPDDQLKDVSEYCFSIVRAAEEIFFLRKDYFEAKFEIVRTFKLPATNLKKTQTGLVAEVLQAKKIQEMDRVDFRYDKRLPLVEIPRQIIDFYESIRARWKAGEDSLALESESLVFPIAGVEHQYGFGGLHGARKNYIGNGRFLQIDVKSFYPTLMINNDFISRASASPQLYKEIYAERFRLQEQDNDKEQVYKLILNKTFGASKAKYNKLFDPHQANNIAINGQLILTHLILLLEPFIELIQTNTDGIIIKYEYEMKKLILDIVKRFSEQYEIKFSVDEIERIAQRDVNNYAIRYRNGKIKAIGFMSKHDGGTWSRNHLSIIDIASVKYYLFDVEPSRTIIEEYKKGNVGAFQMVFKKGTFDGMAQETKDGDIITLAHVNRVFATKSDAFGQIYKVRGKRYTKIPDCPPCTVVHNGDLTDFDKSQLDLRFYINLVKGRLFDESLV